MSSIEGPKSVGAGGAAVSTATATETTKRKTSKRTLAEVVGVQPAPSSDGKVPATAEELAPAAGSTLRSQGKAINIDDLKEKLRAGGLTKFREERQAAFEQRKADIKKGFEEMRSRMAEGDKVKDAVAANIKEIASLMPKNMLKGTSFEAKGEEAKDETAEAEGLFNKVAKKVKFWSKEKIEEAPVDDLELSGLLMKQIELGEGAANSLEQHLKGYDDVANNLNAKRLDYHQSYREAVDNLNTIVEYMSGLDDDKAEIEEKMKLHDPLSREYGELVGMLKDKKAESLEATSTAELLEDWIAMCQDFEAQGEQFAATIAQVKVNATRLLATAQKLIDKQAETASVTAWVADVLKASDMTMLVLSTSAQNEARIVEHFSMRVANASKDMEAFMQVQRGASAQEAEAMLAATTESEMTLEQKNAKLVADWKAGKREVATPTSAERGATTSNPLRAKRNGNISDYLAKARAEMGARHGIKF